MRVPPVMRAEMGGQIVRRLGELQVLQRDTAGNPVVSRMRPQLLAGEALRERLGAIPEIIKVDQ